VGFSPRSGGGLVAEGTVEVRPGARRYELTDWLGSVRVGGAARRLPIYKGKKLVGYRAEVVEVRDYYRYGLDISSKLWQPHPSLSLLLQWQGRPSGKAVVTQGRPRFNALAKEGGPKISAA